MSEGTKTWEQLIIDYSKKKPKFKSRTCKIYDINSPCPADRDKLCLCDRMIRRHSYTGDSLRSQSSENGDNKWESPKNFAVLTHTCHAPINVYGTLKPINCKFLRIDNRVEIKDLFELILEDCNNQKPDLILSIYGGAKYFSMTEKLEKEVIRDLIDAAYATNAWILTAGVNNGVSKLVGEGISHYSILRAYPNTVKCIGMTMWGTIDENTRLELRTAAKKNLKSLCERQTPENVQDDKASIEKNHTHCILFDGGTLNDYLSDSHRHKFVTEACRNKDDNHTCYPVTIIIEGGLGSLEVIKNDVEQKRPIVLIKGSGRLADVLATLIEQASDPDRSLVWEPSKTDIEKVFERFYSHALYSDISSDITQIQTILKEENRHLLNVFSADRDKNVAEAIFNAISAALKKKKKSQDNQKRKAESLEEEKQRRKDEDKLVDLALKWDYLNGVLPILHARQGDLIKKRQEFLQV